MNIKGNVNGIFIFISHVNSFFGILSFLEYGKSEYSVFVKEGYSLHSLSAPVLQFISETSPSTVVCTLCYDVCVHYGVSV